MLWWLAQNTLIAAILALAVSLACRCFRFSPAVRHALWLVVLIKLITPSVACYSLPPFEPWPSFFFEPTSDQARDQSVDEFVLDSRSSSDGGDATAADGYFSPDDLATEMAESADRWPADPQSADPHPNDPGPDCAESQTVALPHIDSQPSPPSHAPPAY